MSAKGFDFGFVSLALFLVLEEAGLGGKADLADEVEMLPLPLLLSSFIADPTGLGADADKGGYAPPEEDAFVGLSSPLLCSLLIENPTALGAADDMGGYPPLSLAIVDGLLSDFLDANNPTGFGSAVSSLATLLPKLKPVPVTLPPNALALPNMFLLSFFPVSLPPLLANE